jgi:hypothetical protein
MREGSTGFASAVRIALKEAPVDQGLPLTSRIVLQSVAAFSSLSETRSIIGPNDGCHFRAGTIA